MEKGGGVAMSKKNMKTFRNNWQEDVAYKISDSIPRTKIQWVMERENLQEV